VLGFVTVHFASHTASILCKNKKCWPKTKPFCWAKPTITFWLYFIQDLLFRALTP
jgi:hypothetical protein